MHKVEAITWNILRNAMLTLDPNRESWFIDAGAGDDDYYFEWATNFGYKALVIEPLPNDTVRTICAGRGISLEEVAIETFDGDANMRTTYGNLHSLERHWGDSQDIKRVQTAPLNYILRRRKIKSGFLKLDIEGSEYKAIHSLLEMFYSLSDLPHVITFEFGGHGTYGDGQGGWQQEALFNTWRCITALDNAGYKMVKVADGKSGAYLTGQIRFDNDDIWGNIIAIRDHSAYDKAFGWANDEVKYNP